MIRKTFSAYDKGRTWLFVMTAAGLGYMILNVSPVSTMAVAVFVILTVLFITTLFAFFLRLYDSLLIGVTAGLLLLLNAYFGLNFLNTVLLISFVLGLRFLVQ